MYGRGGTPEIAQKVKAARAQGTHSLPAARVEEFVDTLASARLLWQIRRRPTPSCPSAMPSFSYQAWTAR